MDYIFSKHALDRANQRGFTKDFLTLFFKIYDICQGSGEADCLSVSKKSLEKNLKSSRLTDNERNLLKQYRVKLLKTVIVTSGSTIVTLINMGGKVC